MTKSRAEIGSHAPSRQRSGHARGSPGSSMARLKGSFASRPRALSLHQARRRLSQEDFRNLITLSSASICCIQLLRPVCCALSSDSFVEALYAVPSRCLEASLNFALWAGRSSVDNVLGRSLRELLPEESGSPLLFKRWHSLQLSSQGFEADFCSLAGDSRVCHTVVYGRISDERLSRIWIVMRDITPQARALQALSAAESHYRSLVERPGLLFARIRADGTYDYMSKSTEESLGLSLEEANVRPFSIFALVHPEDLPRVQAFLDVRREGSDQVLETSHRLRLRDGSYHWFVVRQFPKRSGDGSIECYDLVALDVQAQRDLERRAERLSSAALLGQLSAGAAHDLNNYLTVIEAQLGAALESLPGESVARLHFNAAKRSLTACRSIGQQLMELGSPAEIPAVITSVGDAVTAAASVLAYVLPPGISLSTSAGEEEWLVQGDPVQLQRALINLALNARDAIAEQGAIQISAALAGPKTVEISVSDSGPGVPQNVAERVFEPFFSTKSGKSGHGLGLPTVKSFAEACGGTVALSNVPGGGAKFSLLLPLAGATTVHTEEKPPSLARALHPQRSLRVLIAEDMPDLRSALAATLCAAGHEALPFSDGESLAAFIQNSPSPPHACILDENLPGVRGSTLAAQLSKAFPATKFIVASGAILDGMQTTHGAPFLTIRKPFSPDELLEIVKASCLRSA